VGIGLHALGEAMRPGRLYIKIFLSFLLLLIVTEILIFGLFLLTAERSFHHRIDQYLSAYAMVTKEIVEGSIKTRPGTEPVENESLKETIIHLAQALEAKVWLATPDGTPLLKSFQTEIPEPLLRMEERHFKKVKGVKLFRDFRRRYDYHAVIPIQIGKGETGSLHILFERREKEHPGGSFALGLLGIGAIIALMVIPVSRLLTKRITQLRMSALKIAEGDLHYRATVKGKDEIGELGHTFNLMTDKLEKMIKASKELTAHISHELRSPLARIRVAEDLVREKLSKGDPSHVEDHLTDIREDVEEMDHLIGRILEFSKLDLHERPLKLDAFNPSEMMDDLLERFRPIINQKDLCLTKDISYEPPFFGDKEVLRTALSNVLDNATKFVPEKGHLIVRMHSKGTSLFISMTNTYQALPKEDLSRIFEPFSRAERSPATGYGLGLAITKKIIEKHGGHIEAYNSMEGLEIQIQIPKVQVT
jgi:two-component system sensor histidine kinase CpxA